VKRATIPSVTIFATKVNNIKSISLYTNFQVCGI